MLEFAGVGRLAKKPDNSRKSSWAQTGLGALMSVCNSFDSLGGQIFAPHEPQVKNTEITRFYCRRFTLDRAYFPLRKSVEMIVINQTCIVLVLYMVLVVEYKVDENIVVEYMVLVVEYKVDKYSCKEVLASFIKVKGRSLFSYLNKLFGISTCLLQILEWCKVHSLNFSSHTVMGYVRLNLVRSEKVLSSLL